MNPSNLTGGALAGADVASGDRFYVWDVSASGIARQKYILASEMWRALKLPRVLYSSITAAGNTGTSETDLIAQTIAAGSLSVDQDRLRITARFQFGATDNSKRIRAYLGSTKVLDLLSVLNNASATLQLLITRTGAATQNIAALGTIGVGTIIDPAETLANALAFKFTGTCGATNDVIQKELLVEILPAP